jgi:hypothetical protein
MQEGDDCAAEPVEEAEGPNQQVSLPDLVDTDAEEIQRMETGETPVLRTEGLS